MTQILTPLLPPTPNTQPGGTIEGEPLEVDDTALAFSVVLAATTPTQHPKIVLPKLEEAAQDVEIDIQPDDPIAQSDNLPDAELLIPEISKPAHPLETVAEPEKTVDFSAAKYDPFAEQKQKVLSDKVPKAPIESTHQSIVTARAPDVSTTAPEPPRAQTVVQPEVKLQTATVTQPTVEPDIKPTVPTSETTGRIAPAQRTESPPVAASDTNVTRPRKQVAQPAFIATTPPDVRPDVEKTIKHVAELPVKTPQSQTKLEQTRPEPVRSDVKAVSEQTPPPLAVKGQEPTVANVATPAARQSPATPPVQNPLPDVQTSVIASTFAKAPVEPRWNRVEKTQAAAPVSAPKQVDVAPARPDLGAFAPVTAAPSLPPNHRLERIEAFDPDVFAIGSDRTAPQQSTTAGTTTPSAAPEQARQIAQQMVLATPTTAPGTTEITLNPEELGRVKMSLTVNEGAMILTISAERPDTIDIMRRHIDQLAQTYRQLGFTNMTFNFAGSSEQGQTSGPAPANDDLVDVAARQSEDSANPTPTLQSNGRMDLRL